MVDVAEIERRVDRTIAGAVVVSHDIGGVKFTSMIEVMEFAKLMAVSGAAVPAHLRGNPGACLGIVVQALEWRMSPFAVANKSYIANDRTAYESQLIHAIVEARAPLKGRLRFEILGEGDERRCKVSGTFVREDKPHTYTSETLAKLRDARGRNDRGQVKGSPLWDTQPEVQLFYSASRTWARLYCPDVILGIYAVDELPAEPIDVTPSKTEALAKRLEEMKAQHAERRGFDAEHVSREATKSSVIEGEANPGNAEKGEMSLTLKDGKTVLMIEAMEIETKAEAKLMAAMVEKWSESLPDSKPRVRKAKAKARQAARQGRKEKPNGDTEAAQAALV